MKALKKAKIVNITEFKVKNYPQWWPRISICLHIKRFKKFQGVVPITEEREQADGKVSELQISPKNSQPQRLSSFLSTSCFCASF